MTTRLGEKDMTKVGDARSARRDGIEPDARGPLVAGVSRRRDRSGVEVAETGLAGEAGHAAPRRQLLERRRLAVAPGAPVNDRVTDFGQGTVPR